MNSHNEIESKLQSLKGEIAKLEQEKQQLESLTPAQQLAFDLHKKHCHWNHTDGCGWYYSKIDDWKDDTKQRYLRKAIELLNVLNNDLELARKVIGVL